MASEQPGQVAADDLGLQGQGGGGDEGGLVALKRMRDQRDQVGQGLAGAGAGLHQQVVAGCRWRAATCRAISCWPSRLLAAHAGHGTVEQSSTLASAVAGRRTPASCHPVSSVMLMNGFQFSGQALAHHHHGTGAGFLVVQAEDLGVGRRAAC